MKEGSTVYVLLGADRTTDQTRPDVAQTPPEPDRTNDQTALLEHLEAEISYLREQLDAERQARTEERRRADTGIAQLSRANEEQARTIGALEAPQEPQNESEIAEQPRSDSDTTPPGAETEPEKPAERRGLWRRIFGG